MTLDNVEMFKLPGKSELTTGYNYAAYVQRTQEWKVRHSTSVQQIVIICDKVITSTV